LKKPFRLKLDPPLMGRAVMVAGKRILKPDTPLMGMGMGMGKGQ